MLAVAARRCRYGVRWGFGGVRPPLCLPGEVAEAHSVDLAVPVARQLVEEDHLARVLVLGGDGYAATTMTAIADTADVAVKTLYAVFGNKRTVLTELIGIRVVGDDHAGSLPDREDWRAMERETDPRRQITLFAQIATRIGSRSAMINKVMAEAAGADAEIATIYEQQ